jgi:hypothetical protein
MLAVYYGTILCVSNSAFTIKTAALAWFLFGVMAQLPAIRYGTRTVLMPGSGLETGRSGAIRTRAP